jgi:uracil-DNA glycosylase
MTDRLTAFIDKLAQAAVSDDTCNLYAPHDEHNAIRRANLHRYLTQLAERSPKVMLIGEAPGYQGCRRSGIPFTSDYIMLNPPEGVPILGEAAGYRMSPEYDKLRKEPSATIVWETIGRTGLVPVIFSAYPFHPFKAGKPLSNRAPRVSELRAGQPFLREMLDLFPVDTVLAVGNKAERTLNELGIACVKLRHPSHGGKAEFVAGFEAVAAQYT